MKNKILFWGILVVLLGFIPLTILPNINIHNVLMYPASISNLAQRCLGLILFVLLFWQIILGAYMDKWTDKLGKVDIQRYPAGTSGTPEAIYCLRREKQPRNGSLKQPFNVVGGS